MILFCEECGAKNDTGIDAIIQERAVFTCTVCGYQNDYRLPEYRTPEKIENKERLFKAVKKDPQIIGAFIYDIRKGITRTCMPELLMPEDIHSLGWRLARGFDKGLSSMPDICSMQVVIADKYFFMSKKEGGKYLVLVTVTPSLPASVSRFFCQWTQEL